MMCRRAVANRANRAARPSASCAVAIIALAVLLAALQAGAQPADPVTVRSGEHEDFTRIALVAPGAPAWRFEPAAGGYELHFDGPPRDIVLDDIFARIPRDRLQALEVTDSDPPGLRLALSPRGRAVAFEDAPGIIVVDIRHGAPPANPFRERDDPNATPPAVGDPAPAAGVRPQDPSRRSVSWLDWADGVAPGRSEALESDFDASAEKTYRPDTDTVDEMRERLVGQLARAASQGLVEIEPPALAKPDADPAPLQPAPPQIAAPGPDAERVRAGDHLGLRAQTATDRAGETVARLAAQAANHDCIAPGALDIAAWGEPGAGIDGLAAARRALALDAEAPGPDSVRDLVRRYLYLGFGAEARRALSAFPVELAETDLYRSVAATMDERYEDVAGNLLGLTSCDGPVAMWSVLAQRELDSSTPVDIHAVLRAVSRLPVHLRRHLGPRLAERLLETGREAAAHTIRDTVARAGAGDDDHVRLLDARLDILRGHHDAALRQLHDLATGGSRVAAEATILYTDALMAQGRGVPPAIAESAGALAHSQRDTVQGARLTRAHALGLALNGDFDAAFAQAATVTDAPGGPEAATATRGELLDILAQRASDDAFLTRIFAESDWRDGALAPQARRNVARRLLALGFAEAALSALSAAPRAPEAERLLRARAQLGRDNQRAALHELQGVEGDAARNLRADAHEKIGDHAAAIDGLVPEHDMQRLADLAWRAGDWTRVRAFATPEQRAVLAAYPAAITAPLLQMTPSATPFGSGTAASAPPAAPPGSGPITRARALVTQSADTRRRLRNLLDSTALPTDAVGG